MEHNILLWLTLVAMVAIVLAPLVCLVGIFNRSIRQWQRIALLVLWVASGFMVCHGLILRDAAEFVLGLIGAAIFAFIVV